MQEHNFYRGDMENIKTNSLIKLKDWSFYRDCPSKGTMRVIINRRSKNGAASFLRKLNGRFYIDLSLFDKWMENQKKEVDCVSKQ